MGYKFLSYKAIVLAENLFFSRKALGVLYRLPSLHGFDRRRNKPEKVIQVALQNIFSKEAIKPDTMR